MVQKLFFYRADVKAKFAQIAYRNKNPRKNY